MDAGVFARGLLLGFAIAAPVGPIGVLCIRRTLADGRAAGLLSGLGAATADALYGAVAALGLAVVTNLLVGQQWWLRLLGGLFLCYLGGKTALSRPPAATTARPPRGAGPVGMYPSTFLLTLTNPLTILSFAGVFAGMGPATSQRAGYAGTALLIAGVFAGSALWWLLLSALVGLARGRLTPRSLGWVNRASGLIIVGFGVLALASLRG